MLARTEVDAGAINVSCATRFPSAVMEIQAVLSARITSVKVAGGLEEATRVEGFGEDTAGAEEGDEDEADEFNEGGCDGVALAAGDFGRLGANEAAAARDFGEVDADEEGAAEGFGGGSADDDDALGPGD